MLTRRRKRRGMDRAVNLQDMTSDGGEDTERKEDDEKGEGLKTYWRRKVGGGR